MAKLNDEVEYTSIYFIMGEAPKDWGRNAISDPPSGGWSNAFIIRKVGFQPKIFLPYTVQAWSVPPTCYELERTREPLKPVDPVWMKDCIERNFISRQGLGIPMDKDAAAAVIQSLGFEVPEMFAPEEADKPVKQKREKPKSVVREARAGLISVAQIAEELSILPRVARWYLRDLKVEKPSHGWAGDETWASVIRESLKVAMKVEKKTKKADTPDIPEVTKEQFKKAKVTKKKAKVVVKDTPAQKKMLKAIPKPAAKKAPAKKPAKKEEVVLTHGLTLKDLLKKPAKKKAAPPK